LVNLNAAWFGLGYLWNGLHTILLPVMLIGVVPANLKNTYLGGLTFIGLLLAMVAQPIAGTVSDRSGWLGRYGKRRPWMVLGTLLDVLFLVGLALAGNLWLLVLGYVGLQLASSVVEASLQGLLPDLVPSSQRGRAAGYKNAAQIAGFVAGVGLGGLLAGQGHLDWALAVTTGLVLLTVLWTIVGVREAPVHRRRRRALGVAEALRELFVHSFQFDHQAVPGYARLLAGRALLLGGFFALQGFAQYYVADALAVSNPAGITALLMAVMGIAVFLLAVPTGALADRVGRKPLNLAAGVLGALATLALILVTNTSQLVIVGGLVGASVGIFLSVNWAWAADLVPVNEAGRYLGLSNLATAGASAFSRLLAGPIVDAGNAFHLGLGYNMLFLVLAAGMAAGTLLLAAVPETGAGPSESAADPVTVDVERKL
jgi:MFS family permease